MHDFSLFPSSRDSYTTINASSRYPDTTRGHTRSCQTTAVLTVRGKNHLPHRPSTLPSTTCMIFHFFHHPAIPTRRSMHQVGMPTRPELTHDPASRLRCLQSGEKIIFLIAHRRYRVPSASFSLFPSSRDSYTTINASSRYPDTTRAHTRSCQTTAVLTVR
jgi:hypothetical protein